MGANFIDYLQVVGLQLFILLIWFQTDAFIEYGAIFSKLLKIQEFEDWRRNAPKMTYPTFLSVNYSNFIIKVITCPICLNTWLSILSYFIFGCNFGVNFIGSIILYYVIVKLKS